MRTISKLIHLIFGEYYKHKFNLWLKGRRLERAKKLAMKLHEQHNGMRYFVLEVDYKPGYFQVWSGQEIKAGQKTGIFSKRANIVDFLREAAWYTPSGTKLSVEKSKKERAAQRKEREKTLAISITLVIITVSMLALAILTNILKQ